MQARLLRISAAGPALRVAMGILSRSVPFVPIKSTLRAPDPAEFSYAHSPMPTLECPRRAEISPIRSMALLVRQRRIQPNIRTFSRETFSALLTVTA